MTAGPEVGPGVCHVLREDPDLAEAVPAPRREEVANACTVREIRLPAGPWPGHDAAGGDGVGFVLLAGKVIPRGRNGGGVCGRLGGRGELVPSPPGGSGTPQLPPF